MAHETPAKPEKVTFTLHPTNSAEVANLPLKEISATFLVPLIDADTIIAIQNEKGWDIPGGHLEKQESPEEALRRESIEEGGIHFTDPSPFLRITSDATEPLYKGTSMIIYVAKNLELGVFTPSEDAFAVAVMPISDFLNRYSGDKKMMAEIIAAAKQYQEAQR
jgi:ADP-ribose pyrophosphatase YjhB (NUDIX family)